MRRVLIIIVLLAGAAAIGAIACRWARVCGEGGEERPDVWARMEKKMARMPETFPPRVMFDNVAAIREQTTRILDLMERGGGAAASDEVSGGAAE